MAPGKVDPQMRLLEILEKYRRTPEIHLAARLLDGDTGFKETLLRVMHHDFHTLNARSADLDDHEISIAQKAFTILMQNESDSQAAFQIYVEELLGFPSAPDHVSLIADAIHVRASLLEDHDKQVKTSGNLNHPENLHESDPKLRRLESLCDKAKRDFRASGFARYEKANAAKFLRDTVENTINYIKSTKFADSDQGWSDNEPNYQEKLRGLEQTWEQAAIAAQNAHRGEPRRFERSLVNSIPVLSAQQRVSKPKATEPRHPSLRLGKYEVSGLSGVSPPRTLSYGSGSRRSASPHEVHANRYEYPGCQKGKRLNHYRPSGL
ncbi:MAG: hypothetical protein Q9195_003736 [Heterodermia aff. obscurata]